MRLISRQGIDHTRRFRDLAAAVAALPHDTLILDGEVAVFDEQLVHCPVNSGPTLGDISWVAWGNNEGIGK